MGGGGRDRRVPELEGEHPCLLAPMPRDATLDPRRGSQIGNSGPGNSSLSPEYFRALEQVQGEGTPEAADLHAGRTGVLGEGRGSTLVRSSFPCPGMEARAGLARPAPASQPLRGGGGESDTWLDASGVPETPTPGIRSCPQKQRGRPRLVGTRSHQLQSLWPGHGGFLAPVQA